jgi:DNA modification methylase
MTEWLNKVHFGDCLDTLRRMPDGIVNTCVTSPPYFGLRDYGHPGQIGLEATPEEFVARLVEVFREVRRVTRDDGTCWVNMGDSYAGNGAAFDDSSSTLQGTKQSERVGARRMSKGGPGLKSKDLIGVPWMLAFALRGDGWYLRNEIIWHKPSCMPESVTDRLTRNHEQIFLLSKSRSYYFDQAAIAEPAVWGTEQRKDRAQDLPEGPRNRIRPSKVRGEFNGKTNAMPGREAFRAIKETRNKRSVWTVTTKPYAGAHFAVFPPELIEPCILAGAPAGGVVLDPFMGSGTTAQVSQRLGRNWIGCELNPDNESLQHARLKGQSLGLELA